MGSSLLNLLPGSIYQVQNLISRLTDPLGGIVENSNEELRYEDGISDDESSNNIQVLDYWVDKCSTKIATREMSIGVQVQTGITN